MKTNYNKEENQTKEIQLTDLLIKSNEKMENIKKLILVIDKNFIKKFESFSIEVIKGHYLLRGN